jgi:hypothetical protein
MKFLQESDVGDMYDWRPLVIKWNRHSLDEPQHYRLRFGLLHPRLHSAAIEAALFPVHMEKLLESRLGGL